MTGDHDITGVLQAFSIDTFPWSWEPLGSGHIHRTWALRSSDTTRAYVLQRINTHVFPDIKVLESNLYRITSHLGTKIQARGGDPLLHSLTAVPCGEGRLFHDDREHWWRMFVMITQGITFDFPQSQSMLYEAGKAIGIFQELLSDLPPDSVREIIPGFHDTRLRFNTFMATLRSADRDRIAAAAAEIEYARSHERYANLFSADTIGTGLPCRIVHNDTKLNNVMFDRVTNKALCMIDLDTAGPGVAMHDFGDAVRTAAATATEDEQDWRAMRCDIDKIEWLAKGYIDAARPFLTAPEIDMLAESALVMAFEQGVRFLTDFLDGDRYYPVHRPRHNLDRCRTQFALAEDISRNMDTIRECVERL
jgi:hypothetical protein